MKFKWFHNGIAVLVRSTTKTIYNFGFVILEVANYYQRHSGLYPYKAINRYGEATVFYKFPVQIILESQLSINFKNR